MKLALIGLILMQVLATCAPDYSRPDAALPPVYRDQPPAAATQASLGDLGWWQLFKDPQLLALLRTAVAQNQDINVAAQRVQEAQAQLTITAANLYPNVNAVFSAQYSQTNGQRSLITPKSTFSPNGLLALSYEFDFFGKYRSATAAARAQSLQATYAQETVMAAVVASTASLYFQILELDNELAIARANLAVRRQSLDLVRARLYGGVGTLQDVRQAEQLVAQAQAAIPQIQRATAQAENALSVLLGGYPAPVPRGLPLRAQVAMPLVPAAGLPSELLERRPDIRASEESLIAANAQIGVARSLLFPQITLQAAAGAGTVQTAYLSLGQGYISILPQLVQQIFNAGAARAAVGQAQAAKEAAVLSYIQSVHQGFSDVSDALVDYDKDREITVASAENEFASLDSARLANLRFEGGVTSYLEVLDSQTRAFSAEVQLSQAELSERLDIVDLYQALGGGWQPETAAVTTPAPVQPPSSSPVPSP